jgi:hypothetical protein
MVSDSQVEKKTLLQALYGVFDFICVTALTTGTIAISVTRFGNVNPIPFRQLAHKCALSKGVRRWLRID